MNCYECCQWNLGDGLYIYIYVCVCVCVCALVCIWVCQQTNYINYLNINSISFSAENSMVNWLNITPRKILIKIQVYLQINLQIYCNTLSLSLSLSIYIYIYILWRSGVNHDNSDNLKIEIMPQGPEMMARRLAGFWALETKTA